MALTKALTVCGCQQESSMCDFFNFANCSKCKLNWAHVAQICNPTF
jgi:hypothetical protein